MKLLLCCLMSLFFSYSLFADEKLNIETQQVALVAKILQNSTTSKMQQVWPGYNLRSKPVFITFGNGHIYAFNFKFKEGDWKKTNVDGVEVLYTDKDKWGLTSAPMQFDFEINGQEAFVYRLDMMNGPAFLPFFVLVHERFHVHQIQYFESEKQQNEFECDYPESDNAENLALMQMEELVLLDFMKSLSNNTYEDTKLHLKTYISIHQERQKLLSANSVKWEARQQIVEGLADYASAKNLDVFAYFGEKMGQKHLLETMHNYTQDDDITARALKWRHYGVGASIGYALDFLQVSNWKKDVEHNVALQTILEKNLKLSPSEAQALFQQAAQKYNHESLRKTIKEKIEAYNNMLRSHKERYQNLPGIVVNVQSPPDTGLSAGGYSKGVYSLADGSMFSVEDTSKTSSADNRWILEFKSMPYLFQTNDGFRRFKVSREDLQIIVDGKACSLQNLGQKSFRSLTVKSGSCSFKSVQNQGTVALRNGELQIQYM